MDYSKKNNKPKAADTYNNFFKQSLSQIEVAADLFHNLLPKDILAMVYLTTIKAEEGYLCPQCQRRARGRRLVRREVWR